MKKPNSKGIKQRGNGNFAAIVTDGSIFQVITEGEVSLLHFKKEAYAEKDKTILTKQDKKLYKLCDGKHDLKEMADELNVSRARISQLLNDWYKKNLVDSKWFSKRKIYVNFEVFLKMKKRTKNE